MEIQFLETVKIKPYPKNPRVNKDAVEPVAASIREFGFRQPIVVDDDCVVIAGHTRLEAAKLLELKTVPVHVAKGLSPEQVMAYRIADNKTAEYSEWNLEALRIELNDLKAHEYDVSLTGYTIRDLALLGDVKQDHGKTDPDEVPEVPEEPTAKLGQIWQLGDHRLMCGDSTSEEDVAKLMDGEMAVLVVTDPPYNVAVNDESEESLKARNRRLDGLKIENDNMSDEDFEAFLKNVFTRYYEVLQEGGGIYVFYADSMTIPFMTNFLEAGFHFAQNLIWNKQQFVMTRKDFHYKHEPILYGWKKGRAHNWHSDRKQTSVLDFDRPFRNELHPTMKPVDILEYQVNCSSKEGELVLDLFGGSGSTMIACENMKRKNYSMELDPKYCDVIIKRWEDYTEKKAVLCE